MVLVLVLGGICFGFGGGDVGGGGGSGGWW
jgi:hypothetical protein